MKQNICSEIYIRVSALSCVVKQLIKYGKINYASRKQFSYANKS